MDTTTLPNNRPSKVHVQLPAPMQQVVELPEYIRLAIAEVLTHHPEYYTKQGALGECANATDHLLFACDCILGEECNGYLDYTPNFQEHGQHCWAVIEKYCIDLTARQFDEAENCPKVWLNNSQCAGTKPTIQK